jgi:hypothetical protein
MTSATAIGWVRVRTHRGVTIAGRCSTSCRVISQEIPPWPTMIPARSVVTGTPPPVSSFSTSRRLRRCADSASASSPRPPR